MSTTLLVTDGDDTWATTEDAFLEANEEDEDTCEAVKALPAGTVLVLGGGAVPVMRVVRGEGEAAEQRLAEAVGYTGDYGHSRLTPFVGDGGGAL